MSSATKELMDSFFGYEIIAFLTKIINFNVISQYFAKFVVNNLHNNQGKERKIRFYASMLPCCKCARQSHCRILAKMYI